MRKVAVTGGLASGKTSACQFFENLGAYVVSADRIVHRLLNEESPLQRKVDSLFGPGLVAGGKLDKGQLAKRVFGDGRALAKLEGLLHPLVRQEMERLYAEAKREGYPLFIAEVPLLYEAKFESDFDLVVVVQSNPKLCKGRFGKSSTFDQRVGRQLPQEEKAARANFVLHNDGSLGDLQRAVASLYLQLILQTQE